MVTSLNARYFANYRRRTKDIQIYFVTLLAKAIEEINKETDSLGLEVSRVAISEIDVPEDIKKTPRFFELSSPEIYSMGHKVKHFGLYIFEDGSLSPVYNILGYETLNNTSSTKCKGIIDESKENRCQDVNNLFNDNFEIKDIQYTEDGFIDYHQLKYLNFTNNDSEEQYFVKDTMNAKGVIRINDDEIKKYKEEDTEESSKEKEDIPGNYLYSIGVYIN